MILCDGNPRGVISPRRACLPVRSSALESLSNIVVAAALSVASYGLPQAWMRAL